MAEWFGPSVDRVFKDLSTTLAELRHETVDPLKFPLALTGALQLQALLDEAVERTHNQPQLPVEDELVPLQLPTEAEFLLSQVSLPEVEPPRTMREVLTNLAAQYNLLSDRQSLADAESVLESSLPGGGDTAVVKFFKWKEPRGGYAIRLANLYRTRELNPDDVANTQPSVDESARVTNILPAESRQVANIVYKADFADPADTEHVAEQASTVVALHDIAEDEDSRAEVDDVLVEPTELIDEEASVEDTQPEGVDLQEPNEDASTEERQNKVPSWEELASAYEIIGININPIIGKAGRESEYVTIEHRERAQQLLKELRCKFEHNNELGMLSSAGLKPDEMKRLGQLLGFRVETSRHDVTVKKLVSCPASTVRMLRRAAIRGNINKLGPQNADNVERDARRALHAVFGQLYKVRRSYVQALVNAQIAEKKAV